MLTHLLSKAVTVAMLTFVVSSMLAMGAGLTVSQISEPLRNVRLVVFALLANFIVIATWRARPGEGAWARRTLWGRALAARLCGRGTVFAKAR